VNVNGHSSAAPAWDEWSVNLIKDGGRRVMHCGNAYEDDLEPAAGPAEQGPEGSASEPAA
jgi:hypothetical protein